MKHRMKESGQKTLDYTHPLIDIEVSLNGEHLFDISMCYD